MKQVHQLNQYLKHINLSQEQCVKEEITKPKADGAIIFDKVKVISSLM